MTDHIVKKITRLHTYYVFAEKPHSSHSSYYDKDVRKSSIREIELGAPEVVIVEQWRETTFPEEALIHHLEKNE